jgi:hypothetical protein
MEKNNIIKGQPGLVLLPSRVHSFKEIVTSHVVSIPMSGKFSELYPDFVELTKRNSDIDGFVTVLKKEECNQLMSVAIIEVMFASKQYPDLKDSQIFSISLINFDNKTNTLHVMGDVLEFME